MLCSYFQLFNIKPPANQSVELREWTCTNTNLHVCCPIPPPLSDICRLRCQLTGTATANSSGKKELFIWVQNSLASGSELSQCAWLARIITKKSVEIKLKTRVLTNPTPPGLRWGDPKCRWSVSPVPVELLLFIVDSISTYPKRRDIAEVTGGNKYFFRGERFFWLAKSFYFLLLFYPIQPRH